MNRHPDRIEPARNKFVAHADREAIRQGKPLGLGSWKEWDEFWSALRKFINVLNEKTLGASYNVEIASVPLDAEAFVKTFRESKSIETSSAEGTRP